MSNTFPQVPEGGGQAITRGLPTSQCMLQGRPEEELPTQDLTGQGLR